LWKKQAEGGGEDRQARECKKDRHGSKERQANGCNKYTVDMGE
jgi:hypothetical protein